MLEITMRPREEIQIQQDAAEVAAAAAALFLELSLGCIKKSGSFSVALSGGTTPELLFKLLAAEPFKKSIQWEKVHLFWGDERCVPPDHRDSNYGLAFRSLISKIKIPTENIHRMTGEDEPQATASAYEEGLRRYYAASGKAGLDLVFLGLGNDGHTLSLFPGSSLLNQDDRLVAAGYAESVQAWRLSLTLSAVNNSTDAVFLVTGQTKAGILKEMLDGGDKRRGYPAGLIRPKGRLLWFIDRAAASMLDPKLL